MIKVRQAAVYYNDIEQYEICREAEKTSNLKYLCEKYNITLFYLKKWQVKHKFKYPQCKQNHGELHKQDMTCSCENIKNASKPAEHLSFFPGRHGTTYLKKETRDIINQLCMECDNNAETVELTPDDIIYKALVYFRDNHNYKTKSSIEHKKLISFISKLEMMFTNLNVDTKTRMESFIEEIKKIKMSIQDENNMQGTLL